MSNWTAGTRPGYRTKTVQHGSCVIRIHRPELTEAEASRRERQMAATLEQGLRGWICKKVRK